MTLNTHNNLNMTILLSKKYKYQAVKQKEQSKLKIKRQDYKMN